MVDVGVISLLAKTPLVCWLARGLASTYFFYWEDGINVFGWARMARRTSVRVHGARGWAGRGLPTDYRVDGDHPCHGRRCAYMHMHVMSCVMVVWHGCWAVVIMQQPAERERKERQICWSIGAYLDVLSQMTRTDQGFVSWLVKVGGALFYLLHACVVRCMHVWDQTLGALQQGFSIWQNLTTSPTKKFEIFSGIMTANSQEAHLISWDIINNVLNIWKKDREHGKQMVHGKADLTHDKRRSCVRHACWPHGRVLNLSMFWTYGCYKLMNLWIVAVNLWFYVYIYCLWCWLWNTMIFVIFAWEDTLYVKKTEKEWSFYRVQWPRHTTKVTILAIWNFAVCQASTHGKVTILYHLQGPAVHGKVWILSCAARTVHGKDAQPWSHNDRLRGHAPNFVVRWEIWHTANIWFFAMFQDSGTRQSGAVTIPRAGCHFILLCASFWRTTKAFSCACSLAHGKEVLRRQS